MVFSEKFSVGDDVIFASSANDTLTGFLGNDRIVAGDGDDLVYEGVLTWLDRSTSLFAQYGVYDLGLGNDTLYGGAGFDFLSYQTRRGPLLLDLRKGEMSYKGEKDVVAGFEYFVLSGGNDTVFANSGSVGFELESGDDVLVAQSNVQFADGGFGVDTLDMKALNRGVIVNLSREIRQSDVLVLNFENVLGAKSYSNRLTGNDEKNRLEGGLRADTLRGGWGDDVLSGGMGNDRVFGEEANDVLFGGRGDDRLFGGEGNDRLVNEGGNDVMFGDDGADTLIGHEGNDRLSSGGASLRSGVDVLEGRGGNDFLKGESPSARLFGGTGNDVLWALEHSQILLGEEGNDYLRSFGTLSSLRAYGGLGNDTFSAENGSEWAAFFGGEGNDVFVGSADSLYGGNGADIVFNPSQDRVSLFRVDLGNGNDSIVGERILGWTVLAGSGDDVITVIGGERVFGGSGNDILTVGSMATALGEDGDDRITIEKGSAYGGAGNDRITVTKQAFDSVFHCGDGNDVLTVTGSAGTSVWPLGATGGSGYDRLVVNSGHVLISASPVINWDDRLMSVSGFEEFVFSPSVYVEYLRSDKTFVFGDTHDVLTIETAAKRYDLGGGNNTVTVSAASVQVVFGAGNDSLVSTGASVRADMGAGDDSIEMTGALSVVDAGSGNDKAKFIASFTYDAGAGNDKAVLGYVNVTSTPLGTSVFVEGSQDMSSSVCRMGDGNDITRVSGHIASLDMGVGNDTIGILTATSESWEIWTGAGADHIQIEDDLAVTRVTVRDFDVATDNLFLRTLHVADLDRVESYASGVRIIEKGCTILLEGVTLSQVTDDILAPRARYELDIY